MQTNSLGDNLLMDGEGKAKFIGEKVATFFGKSFKEIGTEISQAVGILPLQS